MHAKPFASASNRFGAKGTRPVHSCSSSGLDDRKQGETRARRAPQRCPAAVLGCRLPPGHALMNTTDFLDELDTRIRALFAQTPAADLQKNLKALLSQQFAQLDLATRAEFDVQSRVLARLTAEVEALEKRLAELEARGKSG